MHIEEITHAKPYCYPIENYKVDHPKLLDSVAILCDRLGININSPTSQKFNLTHLPGLTGSDRWIKYNEQHPVVQAAGVDETDFTEFLTEMDDLYIGQVMREIYNQHPGPFQGRAQLIWVGAKGAYPPHRDPHTPHRYHVPLITNPDCKWLLYRSEDYAYQFHMPADGRVWYLDPINVKHVFKNEGSTVRLHLLLTSGL